MAVFGDAVQSLSGSRIVGDYFTIMGFIPSTVLTSYAIVLVKSGAWSGKHVDFARAVSTLDARDAVVLGFGSMAIALALFPLQFRMIQWLEGYWGRSWVAMRLAGAATARHRVRYRALVHSAARYQAHFNNTSPDVHLRRSVAKSASRADLRALLDGAEAIRLATYYPESMVDIMPTRLGNVLRRHERTAGAVYGLDAMAVVHRLMLVADEKHTAYVRTQRANLDLAVRTSITALLATVVTIGFMWSDGWWLLLALAPYSLAFAAYLGAVRAAYDYGLSFATLIDLNRFALYEALHLPIPPTYGAERRQNETLAKMLRMSIDPRDEPAQWLAYKHPDPETPKPPAASSA
ncbi:MAG TPA: hypothetical protein VL551_14030 [Actinospica sp.]|jgi:hypothetical protein|nr:hypothetical protein [Actinospica sp.]